MNDEISEVQTIRSKIYAIRGLRVMLDSDLARLYCVETKRLNEQVKRNQKRFPPDFAFQLSITEWMALRSQIATLNESRGQHRKYLPYVFTEHGTLMLASILNSDVAIQMNLLIIKAFVELRQGMALQSEYTPLREVVLRIESRMDAIESSHLVDQISMSTKMIQLSREVKRLSDALEQFQDTHIVIKRPEIGPDAG
jgi:hypothetical protein